MPASLYRLAGKQHFAEAPAIQPEDPDVTQQVVVEAQTEVKQDLPVEEVTAVEAPDLISSETLASDSSSSVDTETHNTTNSSPKWDPMWSKTQLLAVANELKLGLTSINTKSEIVAALTAATAA